MTRLDLLLKEHDTLRAESLGSMSHRSQIVAFGLTSVSVLVGTLFGSSTVASSPFLEMALGFVAVPALSLAVLLMWCGEMERMLRAGNCIAGLEREIAQEQVGNNMENRPTLHFESWLRVSKNAQMRYPYVAVLLLFGTIAAFTPIVALIAGSPLQVPVLVLQIAVGMEVSVVGAVAATIVVRLSRTSRLPKGQNRLLIGYEEMFDPDWRTDGDQGVPLTGEIIPHSGEAQVASRRALETVRQATEHLRQEHTPAATPEATPERKPGPDKVPCSDDNPESDSTVALAALYQAEKADAAYVSNTAMAMMAIAVSYLVAATAIVGKVGRNQHGGILLLVLPIPLWLVAEFHSLTTLSAMSHGKSVRIIEEEVFARSGLPSAERELVGSRSSDRFMDIGLARIAHKIPSLIVYVGMALLLIGFTLHILSQANAVISEDAVLRQTNYLMIAKVVYGVLLLSVVVSWATGLWSLRAALPSRKH